MTILNENPNMVYRRFGKTDKMLSVITLGGMRYVRTNQQPNDEVPREMVEQCAECVQLAFKHGINHIETAKGYGKSEHCYGIVLNKELGIPRNSYHLMTKGAPETAQDTRKLIEYQLKALRTDYLDFYGWHGINTHERFLTACAKNGPVEELCRLKEEGVIGHVGFSSHGPLEQNLQTIQTGLFDFANLHYYYFLQRNSPAIQEAHARDMGVFIISPNDKGGRLFEAPQKLRDATAPLTPIQWNARFCLKTPMVQTLSFGMTEPSHFKEMSGICNGWSSWTDKDQAILERLDAMGECDSASGYDPYAIEDSASGINIPEVLRFWKMWKCYDMEKWCDYRYNMFQEKGHWFPGAYATDENVEKIPDTAIPEGLPLKNMLLEFHQRFYREKQ